MLKSLLSIAFFALTVFVAIPSLAGEEVCLDRAGVEALAEVAHADCYSDYQCGSNQICEYGKCVQAQCWTDSQCFPWEKCEWGRCERDPWAYSCRQDSDCIAGYRCWAGYCKRW